MSQHDQSQGLTCPNCSGVVPVPEGVRLVECPFCHMRSLVQGEKGVRRWQVARKVERTQAETAVRGFFSGLRKARDLPKNAEIKDLFLVYLPYWRVQATVAGWIFGRERKDKDSTRPVEVELLEDMHWNDAAVDVSEFGVHRVSLSKQDLQPYNADQLHAEAMVFEPSESPTDAQAEAEQHFTLRARGKRSLRTTHFEKFHLLRQQLSVVYYPLWVSRYEYRNRNYQVVVDGVKGQVLYGKAPGNIFFRAAALVAGMATGNFFLVNGTVIAGYLAAASSDDDGLWIVLLPLILGIALIAAGYAAFRYGEEVEELGAENKKAETAVSRSSISSGGDLAQLAQGQDWQKILQTGLSVVEELTELKK